jgi:tetratricopeptide (TPR) repeat protein
MMVVTHSVSPIVVEASFDAGQVYIFQPVLPAEWVSGKQRLVNGEPCLGEWKVKRSLPNPIPVNDFAAEVRRGCFPGLGSHWRHTNASTRQMDLAERYQAQGKYDEAETLYSQLLAIAEKAQGPDQPDAAVCLDRLATVYKAQGKYDKAAACLDRLSTMYQAQGKYDQAEPVCKRALSIAIKTRGPDHPDVAAYMRQISTIYQAQGRYDEAESLCKRALAINEKALGADHPDVAACLEHYAALLEATNRSTEAEDMLNRAQAIRQASSR